MMIQVEMGPGFDSTIAELRQAGPGVLAAVSEGLAAGANIAAGNVVANYLTGQSLRRRSGMLGRHVKGWLEAPFDAVVGIKSPSPVDQYAWLLGDEDKTITPKKGKFLAIPIGEGLTPSGVARFKSPRDVPEGFFVRAGGSLLFGYKRGKKGKFRALFALVKSVFVQGTGALLDGVLDSVDDMTATIQRKVDAATGAE